MTGAKLSKYLTAAGLGLSLWVPTASAQRYARTLEYLIERPAERGPSASIGGLYTASFQPLTTTRMGISTLGQEQYQFRGRQRPPHLGARWAQRVQPQKIQVGNELITQSSPMFSRGLAPENLGLSAALAAPGPTSFYGGTDRYGRSLAGLSSPMVLSLPAPGIPIAYVPALSAYEHTPRPETTPFQQAFGLLPEPSEPKGQPVKLPADRLNDRTDQLAQTAERDGLALFKKGTVEARDSRTGRHPNCADCAEKLAAAIQRLKMARILDRQAALPVLLVAHALLEQEQATAAVYYLTDAFQRDPAIFEAAPRELDRYFGDVADDGATSGVLEAQLRRYRRVAELNPEAPDALVLQAYCAWRLGEAERARQTLDQLDTLAMSGGKVSGELLDFGAALRKALR